MTDTKQPTGSPAAGEGVTTSSSNPAGMKGSTSGNVPVDSPADAQAGAPQAGNLGAPDVAAADQTKESAGYALEVTKQTHTHAGKEYRKGQTIMLDMAEYRWALENKIGKPGNAEHVGLPVDAKGNVVTPESEKTIEELEAEASKR
jgi:hypothetical protein